MHAHTLAALAAALAAALVTLTASAASAFLGTLHSGRVATAPAPRCDEAPARPGMDEEPAEQQAPIVLPDGWRQVVRAGPPPAVAEWVVLEACILADGSGSRVMRGDEEWDTDDCQQIYELGLVSTEKQAGLIPVARYANGAGHRLTTAIHWSFGRPGGPIAFWAPCPDVDGAETVYGYRAGSGGWGYSPVAFADWQHHGFVSEQALFSVWPQEPAHKLWSSTVPGRTASSRKEATEILEVFRG